MANYFYNKTIEIYGCIEEDTIDDAGIVTEATPTLLKTIDVDIQPYSSELLYKNYGYQIDCTYRIFSPLDDAIALGNIIEYRSNRYKINKVISWDDYCEVFINDI